MTLTFTLAGKPATKGSWRIRRGRGKAWLAADNERERPWADAVGWTAKQAMRGQQLLDGPVSVAIALRFARPKKPANPFPIGDVDKLARSILDALTGIMWVDDKQVVSLHVHKSYDQEQGATVTVVSMEDG
jgi:Holliday junction resolvase RusA-like endonuclease